MRRLGLSLITTTTLALSIVGASARAADTAPEVVSTAQTQSGAPVTTQDQITDWIKGAPPLGLSDDDNGGVVSVTPDRGVHGEAGAFVGNRGYGGYVAATMPVGKDAVLGLAVSDTQYNGRYYRGNDRSLAASLSVGHAAARPAGCGAGVQVGDHYVEPLWTNRFRAAPLADDPDGCFAPAPTPR